MEKYNNYYLPFGVYLGIIKSAEQKTINNEKKLSIGAEIIYGEWHDYYSFTTVTRQLKFFAGTLNYCIDKNSQDMQRITDYILNYENKDKILVAIEVD